MMSVSKKEDTYNITLEILHCQLIQAPGNVGRMAEKPSANRRGASQTTACLGLNVAVILEVRAVCARTHWLSGSV